MSLVVCLERNHYTLHMDARLTPKSLSGFEARFILSRVRQMIASSDQSAICPDDLTALEVIEEIISSSSDAPRCGITARPATTD